MPRFVLLEHDHPHRHWDLLLEAGSILRSWRLSAPPGSADVILVEPTPDHRLLYLDYEGPVSGDRGSVRRWDAGTFEWDQDSELRIGVRLSGQRLRGLLLIEASRATWRTYVD
jgi:hypothetical protein